MVISRWISYLSNGAQARLIVVEIFFEFAAFHIKNVDEDLGMFILKNQSRDRKIFKSNLNIPEDVVSLTCKVVFHKGLLSNRIRQNPCKHKPAAIPKIQNEVSQKAHVRMFNVDWHRHKRTGLLCERNKPVIPRRRVSRAM